MQMVVHLVDRPRAFAELRRVLLPGGRFVSCSVDPAGVERIWLSKFFPSYAGIDGRRFPAAHEMVRELEAEGFASVACVPYEERVVYERELALKLLHGRYASSFALISEEEYRDGVARAEREIEEQVEFMLQLLIASALAFTR